MNEKRIWRIFANPAIVIAISGLLVTSGCSQITAKSPAPETKQQRDKRMQWWRQARFGMFIHWGLYAVPAGEWKGRKVPGIGEWIMHRARIPVKEYEQLASRFNPVKFNADEWVKLARSAGMKYIVITSKHHDGFCMWDSKITDYDIVDATPFRRDVLAELSEACRRQGIRLCFYHSIMDWHHPDAQGPFHPNYNDRKRSNPNFSRYAESYMKPQLKELITNYGPLGVLWFDGEWIKDWTEPQGRDLYNYVRGLQQDIIINNRVGKGRKGMEGISKGEEYAGDFGTPEQRIPATGLAGVDWETCMTMNKTWGYKSYDHRWKSTEELLFKLVDITSKGGNFLLNVGPTDEGLIPQPSVERLAAMGRWMDKNGESIYGTTASPLGKLPWGRCTAKPGKLYLHIFDWPKDGKLEVPILRNKVKKVYLLADKKRKKLHITREDEDKVIINLPDKAIDPIDTVVVLEIEARGPQEIDTKTPAILSEDDMKFLETITAAVVEKSRIKPGVDSGGAFGKNTTGGTLIRPGGHYSAFWIRDYAMSLQSGAISVEEQKHALILTASKQQEGDWNTPSGSLVPHGAIADHIRVDGPPIFFPGTYNYDTQGRPKWGKLPCLDDHFFFVHMAWCYVQDAKDKSILELEIDGRKLIDRLELAFDLPPSNADSHLVHCDEDNRGITFGFTDQIVHTGDLLFCSVLKFRAAGELADLHQLLGNKEKVKQYEQIAASIKRSIGATFASEGGLLRASTGKSCQPDVWGSAFAVYVNALGPEQVRAVSHALADAYNAGTLAYLGNIRHVLTSDDFSEKTAWESTRITKNRYQNGAYWGTPTGWVCYAIAKVDRNLARRLARDYIEELRMGDFRKGPEFGSPWERMHPDGARRKNPVYMTSVTCPLAAFRRIE